MARRHCSAASALGHTALAVLVLVLSAGAVSAGRKSNKDKRVSIPIIHVNDV